MNIIDNVIILLLIVGSFIAGLKLSGHYYTMLFEERDYQERLREAREYAQWTGPGGPYVARKPIGTDFMEKLRTNGRAVQKTQTGPTRLLKQAVNRARGWNAQPSRAKTIFIKTERL